MDFRSPLLNSSREGVLIVDNLFRVIADFQAEQQSDLSVKAGEVVTIHATRHYLFSFSLFTKVVLTAKEFLPCKGL